MILTQIAQLQPGKKSESPRRDLTLILFLCRHLRAIKNDYRLHRRSLDALAWFVDAESLARTRAIPGFASISPLGNGTRRRRGG